MKEKILAKLKLACGETTSISDRTLDRLAATLSATITEETQIDAAIEIQKPFLQELDGNINFVAANAVKNVKPVNPPAPNPANPPATDPTEPAWFTAYKAEQAQRIVEVQSQFAGIQKKEQTDAMVAKAKSDFYKKFQLNDSEKPLFEKAVSIELIQNPNHADADSLFTGIKTQYDDLRTMVGLGGVMPIDANNGGNGSKSKPMADSVKQQLIREGKLPAPQTN